MRCSNTCDLVYYGRTKNRGVKTILGRPFGNGPLSERECRDPWLWDSSKSQLDPCGQMTQADRDVNHDTAPTAGHCPETKVPTSAPWSYKWKRNGTFPTMGGGQNQIILHHLEPTGGPGQHPGIRVQDSGCHTQPVPPPRSGGRDGGWGRRGCGQERGIHRRTQPAHTPEK